MGGIVKDVQGLLSSAYSYLPSLSSAKEVEKVIIKEVNASMARPNLVYRVAGLSGAVAVAMGAYGAHVFRVSEADPRLKETFDTGYRLHLIHSVALMGTSLARRPVLVGTMMATGMCLFSGSCYYHALSGDTSIRFITPYGGVLLILSWLAMML